LTRRNLLRQLGPAALGISLPARLSSAEPRKLNFIFILIDDLGWTDLGCYGSTFYETPNIDRFAKLGMKFTHGYATAPVCSPTRSSVMTGKYPARVNITGIVPGQAEGLALKEVTIAERLKEAGYATASIGKWHLGREALYPERQGFDVNVGGTHIGMVSDFFYPAWTEAKGRGARGSVPVEGKPGDYLADRLTDEALKFIEGNSDRPFFLYLSHYLVHTPMQAKLDVIAKYKHKMKPGEAHNNAIYAAMIESMDESVGRILQKIEDLKIDDRTVVIFTSDNGGLSVRDAPDTPATSNVPLRAGKGYMYEGGIRVPLIVRWPGVVRPGSVCDVPAASIDFFPTMLEMAQLKRDKSNPVDGVSMVPVLKGKDKLRRDTLYWHYPYYDIEGAEPGGVVRKANYKLIEFYADKRLELYDLAADGSETRNLATEMPDKTKQLHKLLDNWRKSVGAEPLIRK